ncbi:EAL domain-containing protein [Pseudomonas sp. FSL R10-0399]|uniref:EAL domain-containing protein n=1 Tax=Pseudomonas sp. FSL R10-0399 TaxID=2662194 RepID=UPI0012976ACF|nr:EAL domain-containing protein [Pseudomonas sp. FSL R10-0399]MQT58908.1 EAL domain-containing protein [Pseudomonas sp. FSL R10-0399]
MPYPVVPDATSLPLYIVYQPVVRMTKEDGPVVFAYEALMRIGPTENAHSTLSVISHSEKIGTMAVLDTIIARMVCADVAGIEGMRLWINMSQSTMANPAAAKIIGELIEAHNLTHRIIIEMTETVDGNDLMILESLRWFKSRNITVVLDDIDDGFAKSHLLDSELIAGCKLSRQSTVRMSHEPGFLESAKRLARWCKANGKTVVMEGIETEQEFQYAIDLGADFCQGFYLWKPSALSLIPSPGTKWRCRSQ